MGEVGSLLKETVYPSKHPDKLYHEYSMPNYDDWKTPKVVKGNSMLSNRIKIKGNVLLINKLNVHQRRIWNVQTSFEDSVASGEFLPYISEEVNLEMLSQVLLSDSSTLDLISLSSGSSNSQKRITPEEFMKYNVMFPTDIKEQNMIAKLLNSIDKHISLHQRKLDNVKMLKKSLLQKLFPKDGEKTPELRFPGFTDAWEQRKLGEVVFRRNAAEVTGALPGVEYEDVIPEEGRLNKNVSLKEVTKKGLEFLEGDVLFGKLRPYLKNWLFAEFNGVAVGDWWVLYSDKVDGRLIYYLIQTDSYQTVANLSTGTKMPRSDWTTVSQTIFAFPVSADEQLKIGKYFSSIDSLISLHQRKLDHLKELKKGLLQQMFV